VVIPFIHQGHSLYIGVHYRMLLTYWGVLVGHLTERDSAEDLIVDGRIILKWFLKKWDLEARTALI